MASPATPPAPPARPDPVDRAWSVASHPRTAAALAAALAGGWAAARLFGPAQEGGGGRLAALLDLDRPLQAWWFTLLLAMLLLCVLAFAVDRVPRQLLSTLRPLRRLDRTAERGLARVTRLPGGPDAGAEAERVAAAFRARGFSPESAEEAGTRWLFAQRGRHARLGEWAALLGVLAFLAAGLAGRLVEWDGTAELGEGATVSEVSRRAAGGLSAREPLPFALRLDRVEVAARSGAPAAVRLDLAALDAGGREVERRALDGDGSWRRAGLELALGAWRELPGGAAAEVTLLDKESGARRRARLGRGDPLQAGPASFSVEEYAPAYRELGPAVRVRRTEAGRSTDFWVFQERPDFDARNRPDRFGLEFHGLRKNYVVTLRVARRPWPGWLLGAAALAAAGLAAALSGTHRRLWARVEPGAVTLAGASHRQSAAFDRTLEAIRRDLGGPSGGG